ncbi:unnamed protein product [Brachionus calyciflorus]|uniref:EGF-like domain-containing protein n=1 Tax=Brachionus calyciflorus TaxID=104777 RepID=A0A813Q488_9BILA|nr:unnamed protein product [Brachionus calyciflorus]
MYIGRNRMKNMYAVGNVNLKETIEEKDLGVFVANDLKWNKQCSAATAKTKRVLGQIRNSLLYLKEETLRLLYTGLVRPHLEYAIRNSKAQILLTGGESGNVKHWNGTNLLKTLSAGGIVLSIDVSLNKNFAVIGTQTKKVIVWNLLTGTDNERSETKEVYSVLIINSTHFLAGNEGYINYINLQNLNDNKKVTKAFGIIRDMKLISLNEILIASMGNKVLLYSILTDSIISTKATTNEVWTLDILSRDIIVAQCESTKLCLLKINDINYFEKINEITIGAIVKAIKIINQNLVVFGSDDTYLKIWNLTSNTMTQYTSIDKNYYSFEILNSNIFLAATHEGIIQKWGSTVTNYITESDKKIYVIKNLDLISNLMKLILASQSTTSTTSTTFKTTEIATTKANTIILKTSSLTNVHDSTSQSTTTTPEHQTTFIKTTIVLTDNNFDTTDQTSTLTSDYPIETTQQKTVFMNDVHDSTSQSTTTTPEHQTTFIKTTIVLTDNNLDTTDQTSTLTSDYPIETTQQKTKSFFRTDIHSTFAYFANDLTIQNDFFLVPSFFNLSLNNGLFLFDQLNVEIILNILVSYKIDLNYCLGNCSGNGFCQLLDSFKFVCVCFPNNYGDSCQLKQVGCLCKNNASCINNTCVCPSENGHTSPFYGKYCELKIDVCVNESCSNNGICYDDGFNSKYMENGSTFYVKSKYS